ncbi:MAG: helix-turn-helix domain-containing protein [Bdellovibrionales bacterium]|nr:helix-turn-helix domain-containing protein [Bdellovibrionales bacterium]
MKPEIKVQTAARILGVGERAVINYIKAKKIEATKVGKDWHVDAASVDAFRQRYGFKGESGDGPTPSSSLAVLLPQIPIGEPRWGDALMPYPAPPIPNDSERESQHSEPVPNGLPNDSEKTEAGTGAISENTPQFAPLRKALKSFDVARRILGRGQWAELDGRGTPLEARLFTLRLVVFESLGSGYFAFGTQAKADHYNRARAAVGSMVGILRSSDELEAAWREELNGLETELANVLRSLVRRIEDGKFGGKGKKTLSKSSSKGLRHER